MTATNSSPPSAAAGPANDAPSGARILPAAGWTLAIDFGTTYTVLSSRREGHGAEVIEIGGERRVPSVVYVDETGTVVTGRAADAQAAVHPARTLRAPKARLGEPAPVVLGGRPYSIIELTSALLRAVYDEAVRYHGSEPTEVRLSHPATWSLPRRTQLVDAAHLAGLPQPLLVPEPVAAAVGYAEHATVADGSFVLVYDFGGGTFDTAALQAERDGFVVIGRPGGDQRLGGELFDELIVNHLGDQLDAATWEQLQLSDDLPWRRAAVAIRAEAQRAKELLSAQKRVDVLLPLPSGLRHLMITRAEFETMVRPYITETIDLLRATAAAAGLTPARLTAIYLVGGASRIPLVEQMIGESFPGVTLSRRGDPKAIVAAGATHPLAAPRALRRRTSVESPSTSPAASSTPPGTVIESALDTTGGDDASQSVRQPQPSTLGAAPGGSSPRWPAPVVGDATAGHPKRRAGTIIAAVAAAVLLTTGVVVAATRDGGQATSTGTVPSVTSAATPDVASTTVPSATTDTASTTSPSAPTTTTTTTPPTTTTTTTAPSTTTTAEPPSGNGGPGNLPEINIDLGNRDGGRPPTPRADVRPADLLVTHEDLGPTWNPVPGDSTDGPQMFICNVPEQVQPRSKTGRLFQTYDVLHFLETRALEYPDAAAAQRAIEDGRLAAQACQQFTTTSAGVPLTVTMVVDPQALHLTGLGVDDAAIISMITENPQNGEVWLLTVSSAVNGRFATQIAAQDRYSSVQQAIDSIPSHYRDVIPNFEIAVMRLIEHTS